MGDVALARRLGVIHIMLKLPIDWCEPACIIASRVASLCVTLVVVTLLGRPVGLAVGCVMLRFTDAHDATSPQ